MRNFLGKVAIVTGSSRGIGEAVSMALARAGASVVLAARSSRDIENYAAESTIEAVADRIASEGGRAIAVRTDLTKPDDLDNLVAVARETFGSTDILINNAAAFGIASALRMSVTRYRLCFEVNVFAPYRLMQLVLPEMAERNSGHIVNITSDASRRPPPGPYRNEESSPMGGGAAYGASKLALEHLTRSVAEEFSDRGISVNALMPSAPLPTQAVLDAVPDIEEAGSLESFVEAVMMLAAADPRELSGTVWYSEDLLHPELGVRGWMGSI